MEPLLEVQIPVFHIKSYTAEEITHSLVCSLEIGSELTFTRPDFKIHVTFASFYKLLSSGIFGAWTKT